MAHESSTSNTNHDSPVDLEPMQLLSLSSDANSQVAEKKHCATQAKGKTGTDTETSTSIRDWPLNDDVHAERSRSDSVSITCRVGMIRCLLVVLAMPTCSTDQTVARHFLHGHTCDVMPIFFVTTLSATTCVFIMI